MNPTTIPEALAAQRDDINRIALAWALESDDGFVLALREIQKIVIDEYGGSDSASQAVAVAIAREFAQACAVQRADLNMMAGINASRAVH